MQCPIVTIVAAVTAMLLTATAGQARLRRNLDDKNAGTAS
jgi:hypothetical protein